jgi:hypothetical protein
MFTERGQDERTTEEGCWPVAIASPYPAVVIQSTARAMLRDSPGAIELGRITYKQSLMYSMTTPEIARGRRARGGAADVLGK